MVADEVQAAREAVVGAERDGAAVRIAAHHHLGGVGAVVGDDAGERQPAGAAAEAVDASARRTVGGEAAGVGVVPGRAEGKQRVADEGDGLRRITGDGEAAGGIGAVVDDASAVEPRHHADVVAARRERAAVDAHLAGGVRMVDRVQPGQRARGDGQLAEADRGQSRVGVGPGEVGDLGRRLGDLRAGGDDGADRVPFDVDVGAVDPAAAAGVDQAAGDEGDGESGAGVIEARKVEHAALDPDVVVGRQDVVRAQPQRALVDRGRARVGVRGRQDEGAGPVFEEGSAADDAGEVHRRIDEDPAGAAEVDAAREGEHAVVRGVAEAKVGAGTQGQRIGQREVGGPGRAVAGKHRGEGRVGVAVDRQPARAERRVVAHADLAGVERRPEGVGVGAAQGQGELAVLRDAAVADDAGEADVGVVVDDADRAVEIRPAGEDERPRIGLRVAETVVDVPELDVAGDDDVVGESSIGGAVAGQAAGSEREQAGPQRAVGAGEDPAAVEVGAARIGVGRVDPDVPAGLGHRRRPARSVGQHRVDGAVVDGVSGRLEHALGARRGGVGHGAVGQREGADGLRASLEVETAACERDGGGVGQTFVRAQREGAPGDGGAAGIGVGAGKRQVVVTAFVEPAVADDAGDGDVRLQVDGAGGGAAEVDVPGQGQRAVVRVVFAEIRGGRQDDVVGQGPGRGPGGAQVSAGDRQGADAEGAVVPDAQDPGLERRAAGEGVRGVQGGGAAGLLRHGAGGEHGVDRPGLELEVREREGAVADQAACLRDGGEGLGEAAQVERPGGEGQVAGRQQAVVAGEHERARGVDGGPAGVGVGAPEGQGAVAVEDDGRRRGPAVLDHSMDGDGVVDRERPRRLVEVEVAGEGEGAAGAVAEGRVAQQLDFVPQRLRGRGAGTQPDAVGHGHRPGAERPADDGAGPVEHGAAADPHRAVQDVRAAAVGVRPGQDHRPAGALVDGHRCAGQGDADRARFEGVARGVERSGARDVAAQELQDVGRLGVGRQVEGAARHGDAAGREQGVVAAQLQRAAADGRESGVGVGSGEDDQAAAGLGGGDARARQDGGDRAALEVERRRAAGGDGDGAGGAGDGAGGELERADGLGRRRQVERAAVDDQGPAERQGAVRRELEGAAGDESAAGVGVDVGKDDGTAPAGAIGHLVDGRRGGRAGHVADDRRDRAVHQRVPGRVERAVGDGAAGERDEAGLLGDPAEVEGAAADVDDARAEQGVGLDERERARGDVSPAGVAVDLRHRHRAPRRLVDGGGSAGPVGDDGRDRAGPEVVAGAG